MKGVVLAGGLGSRMYPLTKVTNKHLLPVYNEPMIYYPIKILVNAGVDDIMIVTGGNNAGEFLKLLGNGADFGLRHLNYTYQEGEGGIAAALSLAEFFADEGKIVVVLGDNIIEKNVRKAVQAFEKQKDGARIMLKEVSDPKRFGVPVFEGDRIVRVEEKPAAPKSQYAVIGIYMYDRRVFDFIKNLKPSKRGELEITDVNNFYINEGKMEWDILDGWWSDAGTFESLQYAGNMVAKTGANKIRGHRI
jgi:glucose-1-phosphate thymidylyltransferase